MSQVKQRNKLKASDKSKITARYEAKLLSFQDKNIDELEELSKSKMSSTDRYALEISKSRLNKKLQSSEAIINTKEENGNSEGEE